MKTKEVMKFSTVPNARFVIFLLAFEFLLLLILGLFLLPGNEGIGVLVFSLWPIPVFLEGKYWNVLYLSAAGVRRGKEQLDWDSVFVTVKIVPKGRSLVYYLFFDDHYLTMKETKSKKIRKKGFYLVLRPKRVEPLLRYYQKPVRLLNRYPGKKIDELIKSHDCRICDEFLK